MTKKGFASVIIIIIGLALLGGVGAYYIQQHRSTNTTTTIGVVSTTATTISTIKFTSDTHTGDFGGFQAMTQWIQANGCKGYHICTGKEVEEKMDDLKKWLNMQKQLRTDYQDAWVVGLPPDADKILMNQCSENKCTCNNWTSDDSNDRGLSIQIYGDAGFDYFGPDDCTLDMWVACCK